MDPVGPPSVDVYSFRSAKWQMVNGFRYYRAMENVGIASALSTALTIYPCQIRVHQRWRSKLQLPTARKKEWRPATAGSSPHAVTCQHCDTHYFSRPRTRNLPIVGWLLVRRATSSATDSLTSAVSWIISLYVPDGDLGRIINAL